MTRLVLIPYLLMLALPSLVSAQDDLPSADISVTADGLTAPESLPAGWVTLDFVNTSEAPFIGVLMRLNDGVTLDDRRDG